MGSLKATGGTLRWKCTWFLCFFHLSASAFSSVFAVAAETCCRGRLDRCVNIQLKDQGWQKTRLLADKNNWWLPVYSGWNRTASMFCTRMNKLTDMRRHNHDNTVLCFPLLYFYSVYSVGVWSISTESHCHLRYHSVPVFTLHPADRARSNSIYVQKLKNARCLVFRLLGERFS